ncbi:MAG: DUF47 family protein [Ignavibacteriales bacterium]|jgi:hypothetical protein|nr:DUF47 family protein [Ignavibacteriales bacterium]
MFKFLTPKEEKYFLYFNDLISNVVTMAELNKTLFSSIPYSTEVIHQIKSLEKRCDEISTKIINKLNKTFITPFDREDILALTKKIEGVADSLKSLALRLEISNLSVELESSLKLSDVILLQVKELQSAITKLKDRKEVENHCKAVKDLESEADIIYQETLRNLFANVNDAMLFIKKKDVLDMMEKCTDKNQVVANLILTIFIKNS